MTAYVLIQISGCRTEKLLEQMRHAAMPMYALRRISDTTVELVLSTNDFMRLHTIARRSACHIHIVRRLGGLFALRSFFLRYSLWGVSAAMLVLLFICSTRILWIDVDGCTKIAEKTVLRALKEEGIQIGSPRAGLDFPTLNNRIRLYDDRIAWVGLSLDGVILRARIVESIPTTDVKEPQTPADIVAQKSGTITRIEADAGRACVSIGDSVSAGDLLIAGDLTTEESQYPVYMHAAGRVLARIAYVAESVANMEATAYRDTGNRVPYREIKLGNRTVFANEIPYGNYVLRDVKEHTITDVLIPLRFVEGSCYEQAEQNVRLTKEEMMETALYEAEQLAHLKIPKDAAIIEKHAVWTETDGQIIGIVTILTEESIGLTKEINIDRDNEQHQYRQQDGGTE